MIRVCLVSAALAAIVAGCSAQSTPPLSQADVTGYNSFAHDLFSSVATYRASASTMQSPSDCAAAQQQYMGHAAPDVAGMTPIAGRMDEQLGAMGQMMSGDLGCGMSVATAELGRHASAACASANMGMNRDEAAQHSDAMESFVEHLQMRSAETAQMMGSSGGMMNGGMGGGSLGAGWTMPDGGLMSWDHQMPGCSFADGGFQMTDGGFTDHDAGFTDHDGGFTDQDAGFTDQDGGMPGQDGGMLNGDGGMMDAGAH